MKTVTNITAEGIHVQIPNGGVVVAPLPFTLADDATNFAATNGEDGWEAIWEVEEHGMVHYFTEAELAAALAYEPPVVIDLDTLRAQLWQSFDRYAREQTDDNSRVSINLIAVNPASSDRSRQRAAEWAGWWSNLWYVYATKRATLLATSTMPTTDFATEVGTAPWTIWEIAE
jgi:hypothetical protein